MSLKAGYPESGCGVDSIVNRGTVCVNQSTKCFGKLGIVYYIGLAWISI